MRDPAAVAWLLRWDAHHQLTASYRRPAGRRLSAAGRAAVSVAGCPLCAESLNRLDVACALADAQQRYGDFPV